MRFGSSFLCVSLLASAFCSKITLDDLQDYEDCHEDWKKDHANSHQTDFVMCSVKAVASGSWSAQFAFGLIAFIVELVTVVCGVLAMFLGDKKIIFSFGKWFYILQLASFAVTILFWLCAIITHGTINGKFKNPEFDFESASARQLIRLNEDADGFKFIYQYGKLRWYYIFIFILAIGGAAVTLLLILPLNIPFLKLIYFGVTSAHLLFVWMLVMVEAGGPFQEDFQAKSFRAESYFGYAWSEWILFTVIYILSLRMTFESSGLPGADAGPGGDAPADTPASA